VLVVLEDTMSEPDIRPCFDGDQWSEATLGAWLAGLFDRAGRFHFPKRGPVAISVPDSQANTLALIQQHLKAGDIETHQNSHRRAYYIWRITHREHVWRVLMLMWPYLTTTRELAYQALEHIQQYDARVAEERRRDREILARRLEGQSQQQIANGLGVSAATVASVVAKYSAGLIGIEDTHLELPAER
jgi:hypothetical protein